MIELILVVVSILVKCLISAFVITNNAFSKSFFFLARKFDTIFQCVKCLLVPFDFFNSLCILISDIIS